MERELIKKISTLEGENGSVQVWKCAGVQVWECGNVRMWECENVGVWESR